MLTKKLCPSAAKAANKPEWHKTAFGTSVIQIWSCLVKVLKPAAAVAECKPLCFLKHRETQPRRCTAGANTHGEDFLWLPTRSHVGVVNLFEDHPGFVMLPHLTGGDRAAEREGKERQKERGEAERGGMNLFDQQQSDSRTATVRHLKLYILHSTVCLWFLLFF